jgi:hypothetical protein
MNILKLAPNERILYNCSVNGQMLVNQTLHKPEDLCLLLYKCKDKEAYISRYYIWTVPETMSGSSAAVKAEDAVVQTEDSPVQTEYRGTDISSDQ